MTLIKPKLLATIDLTFPNYLEKVLVIQRLVCLNDISHIQYMLRKYQCSRKELVIQRLVSLVDVSLKIRKGGFY